MAQKRRFLDVWIIESNTVYREVPFEVVTDWVQQGRLLADDKLRPSGTAEWFRLGDNPSFAAYLPKADPYAANDQAEALEPVAVDFAWKHRPEEGEDDVDMIPLIDVSLVLLVFFMMTAGAIAVSTGFQLPQAEFNLTSIESERIWIGLHAVEADPNLAPYYSIGVGQKPAQSEDDQRLTEKQVIAKLDALLDERKKAGHPTSEVEVRADTNLPAGYVRHLQIELERRRDVIVRKLQRVNEKKS
jgi:biopolymer transport protein ExbD